MPTLEIVEGPGLGHVYVVGEGVAVIGRAAGCNVRLEDSRSSRSHAEVRCEGKDKYVLHDLGSSNGTICNGRRVTEPHTLKDGDEIMVGQTTLAFVLRGRAAQEPGAPSEEAETIIQKMETQGLSLLSGLESGDEPKERISALRFLLDLARTAEEADKVEDLADVLARGLPASIEADRFFLFIGRDENMVPVERQIEPYLSAAYKISYSTSVVRQAAAERVAVLSCLADDERFRDARSVRGGSLTSAICVPLAVGDELLGALYLDRLDDAENFNSNDLELATAAGIQCSIALMNIRRLAELRDSRDRLEADFNGPEGFVGQAKSLSSVYDFINRVAPTDAGVLIQGESGTGKELVARAIHKASPRADRPFVIVNCAALAESLAEAELFGHDRGAFTGAHKARPGRFLAADRGTIFLDEIGELTEPIQAKLLRVLEEGEITPVGEAGVRHIDVRVVAATNRDLADEVNAGRFRRDLYYRLNILRVELPPLREREGDVKQLIEHFVRFFGERTGRKNISVSSRAMDMCLSYSWPGNVRELRNAVERMVILARGDEISAADLPPEIGGSGGLAIPGGGVGTLRPLADIEREHILGVLEQVDNNKKKAAEVLAIDRSTLYAKLKQYGDESE